MKVRCPLCNKRYEVSGGYRNEWVLIDNKWVCPDHRPAEPEPKQLDLFDFLEDD